MSSHFEEHLDAELDALLRRTDGSEQEMQELLETAAIVRASYVAPQPSTEGATRGKARLLSAVAAKRLAAETRTSPSLQYRLNRWLAGHPLQRLALAGAIAALFLLIGNGVVSLSADSLPGDPLYSVKRAQESVRYSLAQDEARREQLREEFDEARAREVQAVRQQRRVVRTELTGTLAAVNGQTVELNGFALKVPQHVADTSRLQVGDRVVITVETSGDGTITVTALELANPQVVPLAPSVSEPATTTPTDTAIPTATATARPASPTPAPTSTTRSQPTTAPSETPRPIATQTPDREADQRATARPQTQTPEPAETQKPSETPAPTQTPRPPSTAAPTDTPRPTRTSEATSTREPTRTAEPTETARPTKTPEPPKSPEPTGTREATETPRPTRTP